MAKKKNEGKGEEAKGLALVIKKYGPEAAMMGNDRPKKKYPVIPTGSLALDAATGIGGLPRGRIIEMFGPESSGKTTKLLRAIGIAQKMGLKAALIDAEHAVDPVWAGMQGVDWDKLLISQPDYGEQALDIASILCESGEFGIIVIDSVAALVPRKEIEGEIGDQHIALQARMLSQSLRMLTGKVAKSKVCLAFINQIREKIGGFGFGDNKVTPGGRALKFYSSMRFNIARTGSVKHGDKIVASKTLVKVQKNKLAPPFRTAEFPIDYDGYDPQRDLCRVAINESVIGKAGAWYFYGDHRLGQGEVAAIEGFKQLDEKQRDKIEDQVRAKLFPAIDDEDTGKEPEEDGGEW